MDFVNAIILAVVEGVTEFLPVSSTGHLILVNQFVRFRGTSPEFQNMFDIVIQSGAILAVILYFWKTLWPFGRDKSPEERKGVWDLWFKVAIAVLPALVTGFLFGDWSEKHLFRPAVVAGALLVGGAALIVLELVRKQNRIQTVRQITIPTALVLGLIQCLFLIPGTSRSAATIIGAMLLGFSRPLAAEFSFFLAIPTLVAASGYALLKTRLALTPGEWLLTGVGTAVSFLVAWGVIAVFMKYIRKNDFKPFGVYRLVIGAVILVLAFAGKL